MNRLQRFSSFRIYLRNFCTSRAESSTPTSTSSSESTTTGKETPSTDTVPSSSAESLASEGTEKPVEASESKLNEQRIRNCSLETVAGPGPHDFATLLRYSKLMELGDPVGKNVVGNVFLVVEDDVYIDFGWKFHCVCKKPKLQSERYVPGARVLLHIKDLELSTRFLGATKDLTLLEADCVLLKLVSSPVRATKQTSATASKAQ